MPKIKFEADFTQFKHFFNGGARACTSCAFVAMEYFFKNPMDIATLDWDILSTMNPELISSALNTCIDEGIKLNNQFSYTTCSSDEASGFISFLTRLSKGLIEANTQKYPDTVLSYIQQSDNGSAYRLGNVVLIDLQGNETMRKMHGAIPMEEAFSNFGIPDLHDVDLQPLSRKGFIAVGNNHTISIVQIKQRWFLFNSSSENPLRDNASLTIYTDLPELLEDLQQLWKGCDLAQVTQIAHISDILHLQTAEQKEQITAESIDQSFAIIQQQISEQQIEDIKEKLPQAEDLSTYCKWQILYVNLILNRNGVLKQSDKDAIMTLYEQEMSPVEFKPR